jgi:hypothetical protein
MPVLADVPLWPAVRVTVKVVAAAGAVPDAEVVRAGLVLAAASAQVALTQVRRLVCRHGREAATGKTASAVMAPPIAKSAPALPVDEGAPQLPAPVAVADKSNGLLIDAGSLLVNARFHVALPFMAPVPDRNKTNNVTPKISRTRRSGVCPQLSLYMKLTFPIGHAGNYSHARRPHAGLNLECRNLKLTA